MRKYLLLCCILLVSSFIKAQTPNEIGKNITFSLKDFKSNSLKSLQPNGLIGKMVVKFPLPNGSLGDFVLNETLISEQKIAGIQTFDATTNNGEVNMKITIFGDRMEGIMHTQEGYFYIEPVDVNKDLYRIYQNTDLPAKDYKFNCGFKDSNLTPSKNGRMLSISPFPVGSQLRKYKLAAAATGEMTNLYGSQANALAKIVSIANATNLIYELEASIHFDLAVQTTNFTIIFPNAATDPFSVMGANLCQASFTSMSGGILPYSAYGIGHTFNTLPSLGAGSFSGNGVAGPTPCVDNSKSRGFTQWTYDASISFIVGIFAHEVGHQFSAPHTYNAIGGDDNGNSTFCIDGWSETSAVEPGSGTTLMSYGNNCVNPTNYTITGNNNLQFFNTKSLEFINNAVNGSSGTCKTLAATGNTPPVANAGVDITIPKGTPFTLVGSATDANNDAMTYNWEQYDVATANDAGALGSSIIGVGGYPAVNSTTAPLFRSEQSSSSTSRNFPNIANILNNVNNPVDNVGEDLPQVARTMKFRFTVRDNKSGGGGVDSDEVLVNVLSTTGPFTIASFNDPQTIASGSSQTVNWNVNNTNTLSPNVKILLSVDEGVSFPYVLLNSTANDGSASITIPINVVNTTKARIKVASTFSATGEFFDINNANITITSTCQPVSSIVCSDATVTAQSGSGTLNLGLTFASISKFAGSSKTFSTSGAVSRTIVNYTNNTFVTCKNSFATNSILISFRVGKTGLYTVNGIGDNGVGAEPFSVFSSNTFNCANFVSSNAYGDIGWVDSRTMSLNACTTYYIMIFTFDNPPNITLNIQGSGDIFEVVSNPSGYSYTYVSLNTVNGLIASQSASSNFITLSAGTYDVYGIMYKDGVAPTGFVGQSLNSIIGANCVIFSDNKKRLNISGNPNPCSQTITLVNPTNNISSGNVTKQASATNGTITATNFVTGAGTRATYQAKNIQLNAGFKADSGTIFKAEIGGCN